MLLAVSFFKFISKKAQKKLYIIHYALFISLALLGLMPSQTFAFSDIAPDDPNRHIYEHLRDINIMQAMPDGTFYGGKILTKAEALTFALRAGDITISRDFETQNLPRDVDPNQWYAAPIARAQNLNIISQKEFFAPENPITKAEFLAYLFRAAQIKTHHAWDQTTLIATDVPNDAWFAADFAYAKKYHIAHVDQAGYYHPFDNVTRQQAAIQIFRLRRILYGGEHAKLFAQLQGEMETFMTQLKDEQEAAAMSTLQNIRKLSQQIARTKNNADSIAVKYLSKSFDSLILSLRSFRYGKNLQALSHINLSIQYADKAAEKSETIAPIANEMQTIISQTLFEADRN